MPVSTGIIHGVVLHGGPATSRLYIVDVGDTEHAPITPDAIDTITYTVFEDRGCERIPVAGHVGVDVPVASLFAELQTDSVMADYNFRHTIPCDGAAGSAFGEPCKTYWVYYRFTPHSGQPFLAAVSLRAL